MLSMNNAYVEDIYFTYLRNPESVSDDWKEYIQQHIAELQQEFGGYSMVPPAGQYPAPMYTNGTDYQAVSSVVADTPTPVRSSAQDVVPIQSQTVSVDAPKQASDPVKISDPAKNQKVALGSQDSLEPITGVAEKIVINMEASRNVPTATSVRTIPVKAMEENRTIINVFLTKRNQKKISFTHLLAWAIVRAMKKYPRMNDGFAWVEGKPVRIRRGSVNMGLAVDVTRKDGSRALVVPSVKNSQEIGFATFLKEYDTLIGKSRTNKLDVNDLTGTTVSLTNPGMIGTIASIPRLMEGQGVIIAAGSIDYPVEFKAVAPSVLASLAVSKVMTMTSTYDHRVIQGAESGEFLKYIEDLLLGSDNFYDQIFVELQIPFEPARWTADNNPHPFMKVDQENVIEKEAKVLQLINSYRVRGHLYADVNPLGLAAYNYPELDSSFYGFTIWDYDREFDTGGLGAMTRGKLRDIIRTLQDTYCGTIGIEYMHMQSLEKKHWVRHKAERTFGKVQYAKEDRIGIYRKLVQAETFERFIHTKFVGSKRFSVEGGEAMIPLLDHILELASEQGVTDMYMGMAHRGRLNTLVNILGKDAQKIFSEFIGNIDLGSTQGSGDVKYHMGAEGVYTHPKTGARIAMTMAPNPSHLEAVNPVVEGMARARFDQIEGATPKQVLPILIHGDAAFAGQGVVPETLNLANLRGYRTGGTVHIIVNNQIGFTTTPEDSRSTTYASDIAKFLQVPLLHVNSADPEAVLTAGEFALAYRNTFGEDVVIDMLCYRKYGHNEGDEPGYTQPLLYKKIRALEAPSELYGKTLLSQKVATKEELDAVTAEANAKWNSAYERASGQQSSALVMSYSVQDHFATLHTAITDAEVKEITQAITMVPEGFTPHPKLADLLKKRAEMVFEDKGIDWGMGEALGFGSLLIHGRPLRLTGQDCVRGTFSHRHAGLVDNKNEREIFLLNSIREGKQAKLEIYPSSLSEYAVLGFEFGYSTICRNGVTLWEAQFGDFVNGAQIMIDQFIASSETKWGQTSNLVMLLPHGYEGQGPEHSSARPERFLQLCAENNMLVMNFSTPANYFHALRRQALREFKKPMMVMTPKSMLRAPQAVSKVADFTSGKFEEIIDDATITSPEKVTRVLLCSGKVYYDLLAKRTKLDAHDVAIVRVEQLYPLHTQRLHSLFQKYERAKDVVWVQEEPKNMGYWFFVAPHIVEILSVNQRLRYAGRVEAASPATGYATKHSLEQESLVADAFSAR
jgi:2-oxoglutarate decarboxylase